MAHKFTLNRESLKRQFAVYVVIARGEHDTRLYVGKTGDNREGCNPVISRCGNHFSYNKIHSQIRNKLPDHERREYTYVFDHFHEYSDDTSRRRQAVERINEMERWLNEEVQILARETGVELLNRFLGRSRLNSAERAKRSTFRSVDAKRKIDAIVAEVRAEIS
jgi:hypothetical protein